MESLLFVDDEQNVLNSLKRIFQDQYQVFTADSGAKGLEILGNNKIQLIISDQRMPNMTGSEFLAEVKKLYPHTIRILLSGYADFDAVKDAINEGNIYKFVTKPWDNDNLIKIVIEAIDVHSKQTQSKEKMKLETEKEIKRLQDEFLANMSHEIRNPLNGIIGFAEILYDGLINPNTPEHKECLKDILTSSQILSNMLKNILELAQLESGKVKINLQPVDVENIIYEIEKSLKVKMLEKNLSLNVDVSSDVSTISSDPDLLKQIFLQLIKNAVQFSNSNSEIKVIVKSEKNSLHIEVKDFGIGIKSEDMQKLFYPFKQVDMSMEKTQQGIGLGLALVRSSAKLLEGKVSVNSTLGKGSSFFVTLPLK